MMLPLGYFAYQEKINLFSIIIPFILIFTSLGLLSKFKIEKSKNKILQWFSKAFYVHPKQLIKLEKKFEKYPRFSDYLVSKLKGLKQFISLPSALTKLPKKAFIIFTTLHAVFWTTLFTLIGYIIGSMNAF